MLQPTLKGGHRASLHTSACHSRVAPSRFSATGLPSLSLQSERLSGKRAGPGRPGEGQAAAAWSGARVPAAAACSSPISLHASGPSWTSCVSDHIIYE